MGLIALIYISRAVRTFTEEEVKAIADISAKRNERFGITGLLLHVGNYFIQVLEGDARAVSSIFDKISVDDRHMEVTTIYRKPQKNRTFSSWNMGYFNLDHHYTVSRLDAEELKRYVAGVFTKENSPAHLIEVISTIPNILSLLHRD